MIELTIDNSACSIKNIDSAVYKDLKSLMSYSTGDNFYGGGQMFPKSIPLISKQGVFPTGLLYIVLRYLAKAKIQYKVTDLRIAPKIDFKRFKARLPHDPLFWQKEAAQACQRAHRGIVVAPTGAGKTMAAILIIEALAVPTLIVVPSLQLKEQILVSMTDAFGQSMVGSLMQGKPIAVENVDALDSRYPLKGYDCVLVDEFHHGAAKTYRDLNKYAWTDVYHRIGMTATPFRSNDDERLLLESFLSNVIYKHEYADAVARNTIVTLEAYYYELPRRDVDGVNWNQVYSELVVNNDYRNELIANLITNLDQAGKSVLCLVKEIKHGAVLSNLSVTSFMNGQDADSRGSLELFNNRKINALIGTTGVLGEGVDTKPAEYIIIAGLGKSKNAFMQQCGRGFRRYPLKESCKVILFYDPSHKWTKAHFKAQVKYLKDEYGVIPVKLQP